MARSASVLNGASGCGRRAGVSWRRIATVSLLLLAAAGCRPSATDPRNEVRIESVERLVRRGSVGVELTLTLGNDTEHNLKIRTAELEVYYAGGRVGTLRLCDPLRLPRRSQQEVTTRWRMDSADPMALYVLERRIAGDDWSRIAVAYRLRGRAGLVPVKISGGVMPVSDFLNTFGVSPDDLRNSLKMLE